MRVIRPATADDVPAIHGLLADFAAHERIPFSAAEGDLQEALFGPAPRIAGLVAEYQSEVVGFALFYATYSTFLGKPSIWLDDLYVRPTFRRDGIGGALLTRIAEVAIEGGFTRVEWTVRDVNRQALTAYQARGAKVLADRRILRIEGAELQAVAKGQR
ncbi:MAG: GNAT family N-acetyltransferase [Alphaproteobacteria bacterium]